MHINYKQEVLTKNMILAHLKDIPSRFYFEVNKQIKKTQNVIFNSWTFYIHKIFFKQNRLNHLN